MFGTKKNTTEAVSSRKKMYSVYDTKAEKYASPAFMGTHGLAERQFRELVNNQDSPYGKFPEDFDLYYMGEFDETHGKFHPCETPQHIVKAIHVVSKNDPTQLNS